MSDVLLTVGGVICALNFYLSFLRVPLLRFIGRSNEPKFISGVPLVGSILVASGWGIGIDSTLGQIVACSLIMIDTGGPHWFIASMCWQAWKSRGKSGA